MMLKNVLSNVPTKDHNRQNVQKSSILTAAHQIQTASIIAGSVRKISKETSDNDD